MISFYVNQRDANRDQAQSHFSAHAAKFWDKDSRWSETVFYRACTGSAECYEYLNQAGIEIATEGF